MVSLHIFAVIAMLSVLRRACPEHRAPARSYRSRVRGKERCNQRRIGVEWARIRTAHVQERNLVWCKLEILVSRFLSDKFEDIGHSPEGKSFRGRRR